MDWKYRLGTGISDAGRRELAAVTSRGRRLVSVADAAKGLNLDARTTAKKLARWAEEGWLRRVKRGLYIAVPVDAENPQTWSEDPLVLADAVWSPCYFTGWTAANHWGLSEHVFRTTVLKTARRARARTVALLEHEYMVTHVTEHLMSWGIKTVWHGEYRLSFADPARTVIDVLDMPSLGGGIRHVSEILATYLDSHDPHQLITYGDRRGNRTVFKRLGYLLEASGRGDHLLIDSCRRRISTGISLLEPDGPQRGSRVPAWGLRANVHVTAPEPS